MTTAIEHFFEELDRRGREERLAMAIGTLRFDLTHGEETEHWHIKIENKLIATARKGAKADAVVRADRALFDRIVRGEINLTTAFFRGALLLEGDYELICVFERLFPGPPIHRERRPPAGVEGRRP